MVKVFLLFTGSASATNCASKILVELVDTESISDADQVGVVFGQQVDHSSLFSQQFLFQKVGQMRIVVIAGQLVQVQQSLVVLFFDFQRQFHCGQRRSDFVLGRPVDGGQENSSAAQVLVADEFLCVLVLVIGTFFEITGETSQGDIIAIEISSLWT